MLWFLYNILFVVGLILLLPRFIYRMCRRGGYARHFMERFGCYAPDVRARLAEDDRIWIQAVSVGEIFVAFRFIEEMRARNPEVRFVLSTNTSTGRAIGEERIDDRDVLIYFPLDFPLIIRRVLNVIQPRMLVLIECELWPNLIRLSKRRGIPVVLVNGRISEHSYQGYRKVRLFTRRLLPQVDLLCAQSAMDADRLIALGADAAQVEVMGSAKYDVTKVDREGEESARAVLHAAGIREGDLILMGGSTWPGEERVLLDVYKRFREKYENLVLVLVPRHVERTSDVVREIEEVGLSCRFRSKIDESNPCDDRPEVFLIDTTGELKNFYPSASVIFVGKSLTRHGGQNIIEPAFFGKAIVVGPNMENFPVVVNDFIDARAIEQVPDAEVLATMIDALLGDTERRRELGRRAAEVVQEQSGAIQATIKRIEERTEGA